MSSPASSPSAVIPFQFESNEMRALTIDGDPWFVAKDVCDVLEYADASDATQFLDDDEKLIRQIAGAGQTRKMLIISESGLYTLIIRSNKPQAKPFRKWVTAEVLPSIRKSGGYALPNQGKRADIFHHRGPVSDSGLDIRYPLDLTKIVQRPSANSLEVLQRLTGVDMTDLIGALAPPVTFTERDGMREFCSQILTHCVGERVAFSMVFTALRQWLIDNTDYGARITPRQAGADLRSLGYSLEKRGGQVWIMDCTMVEVA